METIMQGLVLIAMFALRLAAPAAVILALAYVFKGLDRHWQEQAELERRKSEGAQAPARQPSAPRPGRAPGKDMPGPQLPYDPSGRKPQPGLVMASAEPCWEKQNCSEGNMAQCAAHQHPEQPCWQARFQAEGHIPVGCVECELFDQYPTPNRAKEASNNARKMA